MQNKKIFTAVDEKNQFFIELVSRFSDQTDFFTNLFAQNLAANEDCEFLKLPSVLAQDLETQFETMLFRPATSALTFGIFSAWKQLYWLDGNLNISVIQLRTQAQACNMYLHNGKPIAIVIWVNVV